MRSLHRITWAVVLAALSVGLLFACASLVRRDDGIKFSHKLHTADNGLECTECHGELIQSKSVTGSTWPKEAKCLECHEKNDDTCKTCHENPKAPGTWKHERVESVQFSHKSHMEYAEGKCATCHGGVADQTSRTQEDRPMSHEVCMSCHRTDFRHIDCKMCHSDFIESPSYPKGVFDHDAGFVKRHATLAKGDQQVCDHCHRQTFCSDCHNRLELMVPEVKTSERVERGLVHRGDFLTRHPIEARADSQKCYKCHTTQQCNECHDRSRISARTLDGKVVNGSSPHPAGWYDKQSQNFHGDRARRDVSSCATCHDQGAASNCVRCHKARTKGGSGISPHPAGWRDGVRGKNEAVCQVCH